MPHKQNTRETSVFTQMSQLAVKHGAVNLAQGFPDDDGPEPVKKAAQRAIAAGKNQYAPSHGIAPLREKIAEKTRLKQILDYHPDREVTVVNGATEAVFCAITGLFAAGEEVIAFSPFYESYPDCAQLKGVIFRDCPLVPPTWSIDFSRLRAMITPKTRGLILNSPHNPTGRVFRLQELERLAAIARDHDLIVITDEVYEELTYDNHQHRSIAQLEGMRERTVMTSSTAKTFSMTGWKIGYTLAPPHLTDAIRFVHQTTVFCGATPLQWGMIEAFDLPQSYFEDLRRDYEKKRQWLAKHLANLGFQCQLPEGTYFLLANYAELSDKGDFEFAMELLNSAGVATIPISKFYSDPADSAHLRYLRFGFCKDMTTLEDAYARLQSYFST